MAYIYLLNLYDKIDARIQETKSLMTEKAKTPEELKFFEGRITVLEEFRNFLAASLNGKLPKRIRKRLSSEKKR